MSVHIDYDTERWLFVPQSFPWGAFAGTEEWASAVADAFARASTTRPPEELLVWTREYLAGAARSNASGAIRFVHLPTLDAPTLIVDVYISETDDATPIAALTQQDAEPAIRPADVAPFDSPHLGGGVKATRFVTDPGGSVICATHWVWRTAGQDIVVLTGTADLPLAEAMSPLVDALARSIRLAEPA